MTTNSDNTTIYPVLLSGGSGTRLWPVSRAKHPKQLYALASEQTMLQETALRLNGQDNVAPPLVICNDEHRFFIAEQLRALGISPEDIVLEPVGRNTAPAAAVAALLLAEKDPHAVMVMLPADHVIADLDTFRQAVAKASELAADGRLVTFGIVPTAPETGYGYIQRTDEALECGGVYPVRQFVEKPDAATAQDYLTDGGYYWNSGIFVFRADSYLAALEKFKPEILAPVQEAIAKGQKDLDFLRLDDEAFASCISDSIDYAVMEHTEDAVVIPVDMGWNDIGSWSALWDIGDKSEDGNVVMGDVITHDTRNSYIRAEKRLVATVGIDDLIVIETPDVVFVGSRDKAQDLKAIVETLKAEGRDEWDGHTRVFRPWGYYETLELGERFQVKRLMVKPQSVLSLQMHHHRAEHWVVVNGTAKVTRGEEEILVSENESVYIPIGETHRVENPGMVDLHLIEVQSGTYLGEDDIVRFEDVYGRD
jgi:mannose-1-phosphate guanylyltransferase/mannose-6-phosphate isomerase